MNKKYKSLLEYKKSSGDWHYNPMIKSTDYQYIGRAVNVDFSEKLKNINWGEPETAVDIWEEDKNKPMDIHNLAWGKQQHIDAGYTKHNTKKYQLFNDEKIEFLYEIADMSGLENYSVALFRQDPGQTNPWHFDTYRGVVEKYKKQGIDLSEDQIKEIKRYLIVLEDWDWGHILQIGNNVLSQWRAGDMFTWEYGMYHTSCNAGITPKITAHITGLPTDKALHLSGKYNFYLNGRK